MEPINPKLFRQKDKLYHYTSLASAISILATSKLFMSKLEGLNDINESYRHLSTYVKAGDEKEEWWKRLEDAETELKNYWQISLSVDNPQPGFAIPAMWGHYAERGFGACIVLDKQAIISKLSQSDRYTYGQVTYHDDYDGGICVDGASIEYFESNKKEIFFQKTKDWACEQEFRIICRGDKEQAMIDLEGCVMAVILCYARGIDNGKDSCFSSLAYKRLNSLFPNIPILEACISDGEPNLWDADGNKWYPKEDIQDIIKTMDC